MMRRVALVIKRGFDLLFALVAVLLLSPLLIGLAIAIRLDSPGPAIFTQVRSGLRGKPFTIYKFRTMTVDPQREVALVANDSSITRVGNFLRNTSLDELPQILNILNGTMSLIGPRPTVPEQVEKYDAYQRRRLEMPPGLTGWAQVNGRNALPWDKRIALDVWYVEHWSLWLDLRIFLRTFKVVLFREGVYGEGGVNKGF